MENSSSPLSHVELVRLPELTRLPRSRVSHWQRCGAWKLPRVGKGPRRYDVWDVVRAEIIRAVSDAGLPITGEGEMLTGALVGAALYAATTGPGDLSGLADQVKIYRDADGEWCIDLSGQFALDDDQVGSVVTLIRLRRIVEAVGVKLQPQSQFAGVDGLERYRRRAR